jgi:RNA polymerase sigma-70 factor, ECF subfamily
MGVMVDGLTVLAGESVSTSNFHTWMLAEQRRVFLLCQRLIQDREDADAASQDVFLKAWLFLEKSGGSIEEPAKWLTRIAVNTCLDRLRSKRWQFWRKRPEARDEELILSLASVDAPSPEDRVLALEIGQRLAEALKLLSDRQRAVFTLRHYEDRSLEEIAELLEMEVGTVKSHLSRALAKMRLELKDLYSRRSDV